MRRARPYLIALLVTLVLPTAAITIIYSQLSRDLGGYQCEGIGFGCTMTQASTFLYFAFIFGAPAIFLVSILTCAMIAFVRRGRTRTQDVP